MGMGEQWELVAGQGEGSSKKSRSKEKDGEREVREILDGLRIERGRVLLMAKKEEHERVAGAIDWQEEPIYGTQYRVQRFESEFVTKVVFV